MENKNTSNTKADPYCPRTGKNAMGGISSDTGVLDFMVFEGHINMRSQIRPDTRKSE